MVLEKKLAISFLFCIIRLVVLFRERIGKSNRNEMSFIIDNGEDGYE